MKSIYRTLLVITSILLLFSAGNHVFAQDKTCKSRLDISGDVVSRYIWRGLNLGGTSPSIQPGIEYGCGNFAIGAWGAYSINNDIKSQEADLYLSYTIADLLNFTVTDYFLPSDTARNRYFNYGKDETGHLFEASAKFLGTEKIPFTLLVATNLYGADAKRKNGDNQYSTYVEFGYNFGIGETSCNAFLGFTPTKPDKAKEETGFYGPHPGVINLGITGSKEIKITDTFTLPVNASLITNPQKENIFLVFGISL